MCRAFLRGVGGSFFGWLYVPAREKDFFFCKQSFPLGGETSNAE